MLDKRYQNLLSEYLSALAQAQRRVSTEYLANLLDCGAKTPSFRLFILPVIGETGRWLAAQNPVWHYATNVQLVRLGFIDETMATRLHLYTAGALAASAPTRSSHRSAASGEHVDVRAAQQPCDFMEVPVKLVTSPHTPVPFSPALEDIYVPTPARVVEAAQATMI